MTTIYTTRADSKPFEYGPTTGPKKTVQLPGGLRVAPIATGSTAGLFWLDEFPPAIFPPGSIERHDAEHYGVVIPLGYLNYRFEPPYEPQWTAHQPNGNRWQDRHLTAIASPTYQERGIVQMLKGWIQYANDYPRHFDSDPDCHIGADGVLGEYWAETGRALLKLLDGPTGRLDNGTISSLVHGILRAEGISDE